MRNLHAGSRRLLTRAGRGCRRHARRAVASKYATDPPAGWKVPRTADGKPDLQGVWGNNSVTPMTRPTQWKDKTTLTDAEVDELKQLARAVRRSGRRRDLRQLHPAWCSTPRTRASSSRRRTTRRTGNYNQFWMADREWDNRTSLIIDPPDGQFPPLTPRRRPAATAAAARPRTRGPADGPEDRPLSERCISYGAPRTAAELQQLHADHPVARDRRPAAGDDSRRARRADDRTSRTCRRRSASCTAIRAAAGKATRWSSRRRTTSTDSRDRRRT